MYVLYVGTALFYNVSIFVAKLEKKLNTVCNT